MIKRIRKVEGIGTFNDFFRGGRFQFEKLTLIHGLNCYGKSTLCDIFSSLANNNTQLIIKRKTINPNRFKSQNVELTFSKNGTENNIIFQNNTWDLNGFDEKIEIFDSRFISENIFTGLEISRSNKEKITDFIFGEDSVRLVKELQDLNQKSRSLTRSLNEKINTLQELIPQYDIDKFLKLAIDEDVNSIQKSINELLLKKQKINKNIDESATILNKSEPTKLNLDIDISYYFNKINALLAKSYEDINQDAANKMLKHIELNVNQKDGLEEQWIKQGFSKYIDMSKLNESNCPLCGQNLEKSIELIKIYQDYFNEEYNNFIVNIEIDLNTHLTSLKSISLDINIRLKNNILILKEYESLIENSEYTSKLNNVGKLSNQIDDLVNNINKELKQNIDQLQKVLNEKVKKPHLSQDKFDYSKLNSLISDLEKSFSDVVTFESYFDEYIETFKNKFKTDEMTNELNKISKELNICEVKKKRIENNFLCDQIKTNRLESIQLKNEIRDKTRDLERNQNIYLKKYFDKINSYFKEFGSNEFKIEKYISRKGNKPVISIKVYFKNKAITENDLSYVFGDSDRRALALSIFWAKLKIKNDTEKGKSIVVLDDPITSFDENRMSNSINGLIQLVKEVDQIIVFSHYVNFIQRIIETNKNVVPIKLLRIKKAEGTSVIDSEDIECFCQSVHDKTFIKIQGFINSEHENDISKDLRVYLEDEIKNRFKKQISKYNLKNLMLKDMVYQLYDNRLISEDVYNKIEEFLNTLNPEHHIFTTSNIEDKRSIADNLINFIYYELSPTITV